MATSMTENIQRREDWSEPPTTSGGGTLTRAEWLWTLFGIALLVVFVFLVIEDYPLRTILAVQ